ncbi:MAG: hypothetical protein R2690_17740 [Acidimicrobiales bacterium]
MPSQIGVIVAGEVRLDVVRQGVEAGGGGDVRRQADGERRVGEDDLGQQVRREDDALDVGVVGDDGRATDLAAGAGGRRDGDEVRDAVLDGASAGDLVLVVEQVAVVGGHHADGLGDVEGGAAADPDDGVGTVGPVRLDAGRDLGDDRVADDAAERGGRQPGAVEPLHDGGEERQRRHADVGDQQRPGHAGARQHVGELVDRSGAEADRRREAERGEVGRSRPPILPAHRTNRRAGAADKGNRDRSNPLAGIGRSRSATTPKRPLVAKTTATASCSLPPRTSGRSRSATTPRPGHSSRQPRSPPAAACTPL